MILLYRVLQWKVIENTSRVTFEPKKYSQSVAERTIGYIPPGFWQCKAVGETLSLLALVALGMLSCGVGPPFFYEAEIKLEYAEDTMNSGRREHEMRQESLLLPLSSQDETKVEEKTTKVSSVWNHPAPYVSAWMFLSCTVIFFNKWILDRAKYRMPALIPHDIRKD